MRLLPVGDFTFRCGRGDVVRAPSDVPPGASAGAPGAPEHAHSHATRVPLLLTGAGTGVAGRPAPAAWQWGVPLLCVGVSVGTRPRSPAFPSPPTPLSGHTCSGLWISTAPRCGRWFGAGLGSAAGCWAQARSVSCGRCHEMAQNERSRTPEVCSRPVRSQKPDAQPGQGCTHPAPEVPGKSSPPPVQPLVWVAVPSAPHLGHMATFPRPACLSESPPWRGHPACWLRQGQVRGPV